MATLIGRFAPRHKPIAADGYEKFLAAGAIMLLAAVAAAIARGHAEWTRVPLPVWLHIATVALALALALTPVMLLRRRGDRRHRLLATALISLFVHQISPGHFSVIHILSVWTLVQVPIIWWSARRHRVARHRMAVRGMVTGALLIAGFFTFPFHRLLGHWLFG